MEKWEYKLQKQQERLARHQARWAHKQQWKQHHGPAHAVFVGGIIIAVGTIFLLDNLGVIHFHDIWQYWPAILIVFGASRMADSRGFGGLAGGGIMIGFGTLLLLQNIGLLTLNWNILWPALLIAWGFVILLRPRHWRRQWYADPAIPGTASPAGPAPNVSSEPAFELVTVFGGGRRQMDSQDFRGGEVTAVFGGYELDLRSASIVSEQPAVIEATAIFGGVEIKVPGTWVVEARGVGVFGGFGDETRPPRPGEVTREQRLIVTGSAIFGGVSIKN